MRIGGAGLAPEQARTASPPAAKPGTMRQLHTFRVIAMLRVSIAALTLALLPAEFARAQITDITSGRPPGADGQGISFFGAYERPMTAADMRAQEIERDYRKALTKIPNKKPSRDPWAGVRSTTSRPEDRHRPE
jgi:hypothetical protein